jgi:hypothetical protein
VVHGTPAPAQGADSPGYSCGGAPVQAIVTISGMVYKLTQPLSGLSQT